MSRLVLPGWTGFDGGLRRAFSFSRRPKVEEDVIIKRCRKLYGDFLFVDVAGIVPCPGTTFTSGINGDDFEVEYFFTTGGVAVYSAIIGTADAGGGDTNVELQIGCAGANHFTAAIGGPGQIFLNLDPDDDRWAIGDLIPNQQEDSGVCSFPIIAYAGTVKVKRIEG